MYLSVTELVGTFTETEFLYLKSSREGSPEKRACAQNFLVEVLDVLV